jgi:hypothetical protein
MRIHGLAIQANVVLPGIARTDSTTADVELELVDHLPPPIPERTRYRAGDPDDKTTRVEIVDDTSGRTSFRYGDGSAFDVELHTRPARISAAIAPGQTLEDLCAYLYGPVLGYLLRAWGRLALHASCIRIDDDAVLLAGDSGSGKSTLAAALAALGSTVVSDDLTALTTDGARTFAWPAFDHVRLWPDAEHLVLPAGERLERITPTWDKRRFALTAAAFAQEPTPVRAIVVLRQRRTGSRAASRSIAPPRAVLTLATLTYANYLLDNTMRATELAQLGALVRTVSVHALTPASGRAGINSTCEAILRIAARLSPSRR